MERGSRREVQGFAACGIAVPASNGPGLQRQEGWQQAES